MGQLAAAADDRRFGPMAGMRVAVHHGPVYAAVDPVTKKPGYFGLEVTRTARIEPVTPIGQVYITRAFAVGLELEAGGTFQARYVGDTPLAKKFGSMPMYRLTR